jgi:hypothetical protein
LGEVRRIGVDDISYADFTSDGGVDVGAICPVDVRYYGVVTTDDETTDQGPVIQSAITRAMSAGYPELYFPPGDYRIGTQVVVDASSDLAPKLVGAGKSATKFIVDTGGTTSAFKFTGTTWISHTGLSCARFDTDDADKGTGCAIELNCINGAKFEDLWIEDVNYGIWLHNDLASRYNENNVFRDIGMANVNNGIRMEQGVGTNSFHGNEFDHITINLYGTTANPQTGFNHVSGLYYNGRFNIIMWAASTATYDNSIFVQADGTGTTNIGTITVETLTDGTGSFEGTGRFWWNGWLRTFGTVTDNAGYNADGGPVIMANNYIRTVGNLYDTFTTVTKMSEGPYSLWNDGIGAGMFTVDKTDNESLLVTGYQSGAETCRLYTATIPYQGQLNDAITGLSIALDGSTIRTHRADGFVFSDESNIWIWGVDDGVMKVYKMDSVIFNPRSATGVGNNTLFLDVADYVLKFKDNGGTLRSLW